MVLITDLNCLSSGLYNNLTSTYFLRASQFALNSTPRQSRSPPDIFDRITCYLHRCISHLSAWPGRRSICNRGIKYHFGCLKYESSTILGVFSMNRLGIVPRSSGPSANTNHTSFKKKKMYDLCQRKGFLFITFKMWDFFIDLLNTNNIKMIKRSNSRIEINILFVS